MLKILTSIFKTPDLKAKVLYILGIFVIFRIVAAIPLSIIDTERLQRFFSANPLFGLLNVFTGSTMENFSLVMLGLGPYITAVIIMQLMTMIFPKLKELYQREGEAGRQRFSQYGRLLTIPLSALQGFSILTLLHRQNIIAALAIIFGFLALLFFIFLQIAWNSLRSKDDVIAEMGSRLDNTPEVAPKPTEGGCCKAAPPPPPNAGAETYEHGCCRHDKPETD